MELIGYVSNGYPTMTESMEMTEYFEAGGCDSLMIDFPARDPVYETEFVKSRMAAALEACGDYNRYMDNIMEIRRFLSKIRLIIFVYAQTVQEIGIEKFADFCLANRIRDVLLLGDQDNVMRDQLAENGLRISFCVQSDRLSGEIETAKASNGFVCLRFSPNDTVPIIRSLTNCIQALCDEGIELPIYCDIGVSSPMDFVLLKKTGANGGFFGNSALPYQTSKEIEEAVASIKAAENKEN